MSEVLELEVFWNADFRLLHHLLVISNTIQQDRIYSIFIVYSKFWPAFTKVYLLEFLVDELEHLLLFLLWAQKLVWLHLSK